MLMPGLCAPCPVAMFAWRNEASNGVHWHRILMLLIPMQLPMPAQVCGVGRVAHLLSGLCPAVMRWHGGKWGGLPGRMGGEGDTWLGSGLMRVRIGGHGGAEEEVGSGQAVPQYMWHCMHACYHAS